MDTGQELLAKQPDKPIAIGQPFLLILPQEAQSVAQDIVDVRSPLHDELTYYSLSLPAETNKSILNVRTQVTIHAIDRKDLATRIAPITPLDSEHTYIFDERDEGNQTRAEKLKAADKTNALTRNPFDVGIMISGYHLLQAGIIAHNTSPHPDDHRMYVPAKGYEYINRLALIIQTPIGMFVSTPDTEYFRMGGVLNYYRFAPLPYVDGETRKISSVAGKYDFAGELPPGNPLHLPASQEGKPITEGIYATFVILNEPQAPELESQNIVDAE